MFDKDGTLFDFATTWEAWASSFLMRLAEGDLARATTYGAAVGFEMATGTFHRDSVAIAGTVADIVEVLAPLVPDMDRASLTQLINQEAERAPQAEAVPLHPFLAGLRARGLMLGVATNDSEAPARAHLTAAGVVGHFDFIAGYDSGHGGKPAPGQLLAFCKATGLAPDTVVMVGDSLHDLRAGRAAGMRCLGVLTGLASADDLAPHAEAVLPNIGHIPAWLESAAAV